MKRSFTFIPHSVFLLFAPAIFLIAGCGHHSGAAPVVPAHSSAGTMPASVATTSGSATVPTAAAAPVQTYSNPTAGIQLSYPASWKPEKAQTAVLAVAAPAGTSPGYSSLSLDIPKLPWHIKNMIPISVVSSDYISDLKKNQITDAVVQEETTINVPDASARRITSVGHENGKPSIDVAVIMVHADQVFILSADSDDAGKDLARKTIDSAVASLKWTK
jgi:hypothetical protein